MHIPTIPACGALVLLGAMLGACGSPTVDEPTVAPPDEPAVAVPDEPAAAVPDEPAAAVPDEPAVAVPDEPAVAVPDEPTAAPMETALPDKHALAFYCQYMKDLDLAAFMVGQPKRLQEAMAEDMKGKATTGEIAGFDAFWAHLMSMEPAEKQGWIDAGIAAHGLDAECIAVKGPSTGG
ncbi:MAG: hypothetical protein JRI25_21555 [Deltaproteobacteria bacterium]|nr:hypothetical protein [Deltaproteobacteria bacterium]MBW2257161.1 hypothetical protein [Deltaproteobacteria bacterium]